MKISLIAFLLLALVAAVAVAAWLAQAPGVTPYRFAGAPTPAGQTGVQVYAQRCSTCHGDVGQGLTAAWRATWDAEHQNCSSAKCHGRDHPEEGFYLPNNYAPAVVSPNALRRFSDAQALYAYVSHAMPFSAPGDLTPEQYWRVVNFLLWANGVIDVPYGVTAQNAAQIQLNTRLYTMPHIQPATPVPQPVMGGAASNPPAP